MAVIRSQLCHVAVMSSSFCILTTRDFTKSLLTIGLELALTLTVWVRVRARVRVYQSYY